MSDFTLDDLSVDYSSRDAAARSAADDQAKVVYREHGCFLAKGLLSATQTDPVLEYIRRLIDLRLRSARIVPEPESDGQRRFDDGFLQLSRADRSHGGAIFDAGRRLLPLHQLSVDPDLIHLAAKLMGTETMIASDVKAVRVDHPREDRYLFDWHQDYPYIMDSEDAVVFWLPLQDVDETNGCLRVAPGTHQLGLLDMHIHDFRNQQNNKQKFMEIADPSVVEQYPQVSAPAKLGDVLVFSTMTLHASQANTSSRARWTAQIRFGNFEHPGAVARKWPGSLRDGSWFDEQHPERVVNLDQFLES